MACKPFPSDNNRGNQSEENPSNPMLKALLAVYVLTLLTGCTSPQPKAHDSVMQPRINVITLGVSDLQRSYHFYKDGLGFPTKMSPDGGIIMFAMTTGTTLMLYPYDKLAKDAQFKGPGSLISPGAFPGFTLGYCVQRKEQVDAVLAQVEAAGGTIAKKPVTASWGGYSGYFRDPDGYSWEVLYSSNLKFKPDGSVTVDR
jgi:catechol 2,3-dioxygenase-like lactoylglutathione lyase family enzyme